MDDDLTLILFLACPPFAGELVFLFLFFRSRWGDQTRQGWARVLIVNSISVFLVLVLMFLGGELYFRFVYDKTDSLSFTKVSQRWMKRYFVENSAGFRDNIQYSKVIEPGKRRISFIGDSFTAGHGVRSVEDRFANIIRAVHPEWEIHVFAKLGADTGDEIKLIQWLHDEGYQFDYVVLVYCPNDVEDLIPEWWAGLKQLSENIGQGGWIRHHSFFADMIYARYKFLRNPLVKKYFNSVREDYKQPWELQEKRLVAIRDFVQQCGGRLLVVTFPYVHAVGPHYEYQFIHDKLNQFWRDEGVPHLDLLTTFSNLPPEKLVVNRFDAHPNEFANALAAKQIDLFLRRYVNTNDSVRSPASDHSQQETNANYGIGANRKEP